MTNEELKQQAVDNGAVNTKIVTEHGVKFLTIAFRDLKTATAFNGKLYSAGISGGFFKTGIRRNGKRTAPTIAVLIIDGSPAIHDHYVVNGTEYL